MLLSHQLREEFLSFFESKGHLRLPGASLIPHHDPTLLLTGAGMVPFKPYFLGKAKPPHPRITTCQPCVRTPDIDNVGKTDRHATFFEMLGNFSFGDYFKEEAITWAWEFVTQRLGLDPQRLWITIYLDDDEAFRIWHERIGVPAERIVRLGRPDNFWEIGVGPCGPCSEIHVDRGSDRGCRRPECAPGCSCDRFLEIWNLVFIQFHKDERGEYHSLEKKSIDTGMGLERAALVLQGVNSIFDVDHVRPIVDRIAELAGVSYGQSPQSDVGLRVITDHGRGITFMVSDGILPSNEGRGYVLRRLLRRAVRYGRLLGIERPLVSRVAAAVIEIMGGAYPQLRENREFILRVIGQEEERFRATLDQGTALLQELIEGLKATGRHRLEGADAFRLYDTYGFPLELTREIAAEHELSVDEEGFREALEAQRERARAAREEQGYLDKEATFYTRLADELRSQVGEGPLSRFVGYEESEVEARVLALTKGEARVERALPEEEVQVVLDVTPFYAEAGGQVADTGLFLWPEGEFEVLDVRRPAEDLWVHYGRVRRGVLSPGMKVRAAIDLERRMDIARHHTATHLLHRALREVLGEHVRQAGSLVAPDRLRFDFTHFAPVEEAQLRAVERLINRQILLDQPVEVLETTRQEAERMGALALFEAKYGEKVRVVRIGDFSLELCGGTHLSRTGQLGLVRILSETGVAAGVRRVEAVGGELALDEVEGESRVLREVCRRLKVSPPQVLSKVDKLQEELRDLHRQVEELKQRLAKGVVERLVEAAEDLGGTKIVLGRVDELEPEALRQLGDQIRDRIRSGVVALASSAGGRANLIVMATPDAVARGVHAGQVVKAVAPRFGGGGGGRPEMAQAGGKDPQGLEAALEEARLALRAHLAGKS